MNFLHYQVDAGPDSIIEVSLDKQANVRLLDPPGFENFKAGTDYTYRGGVAMVSPLRLRPPSQGQWHIVVDLGDDGGMIRAGIKVLSNK